MLSSHEASFHSRFLRSVALAALALAACAGLAGCGGGSGGGGQVMIMPGPAQEPPDLVVESPQVSDPNPSAGEGFKLSATVRNAGGRAAPAATLRFYRSDDAAISISDEEVGSEPLEGLAAGGSVTESVTLTAPQAAGAHYYGACVDAAPGESDAANTCSPPVMIAVPALRTPALEARTPRPAPPRPDLVVESPSALPASPAAGNVFDLRVYVSNVGSETRSISMRYYRSDDATFTESDPHVGSYWARWVGPNSRFFLPKTLDAPEKFGVYYYRACAAPLAGESNTANNCSAALKVSVTHDKPNLQIYGTGTSQDKGAPPGSPFRIFVVVQNLGGPAPETTVRFYHSTDKTFTSSGTELAGITVPALRKTQSQRVPRFISGKVSVTWPTTSGTHYYGACVDAVANELDTTDNCKLIHTIRG